MAKKNKLDTQEKMELASLQEEFNQLGGQVFSFKEKGLTIAIQPRVFGRNPDFFNVSVAYCSTIDKFSHKRGAYEVLLKILDGEFMICPSFGHSASSIATSFSEFLQ